MNDPSRAHPRAEQRSVRADSAVVVIPTLNEAAHITGLLDELLHGLDERVASVWVVDGGSDDDTRAIAEQVGRVDHRVRTRFNSRRTQGCAINLAAREIANTTDTEYLIRIDAHARYPADFCRTVLDSLSTLGADSVVVPLRTIGGDRWRNAGERVFNSWIGHGNSPHRANGGGGWVSHGHHAGFRLSSFLAIDGYDESFVANEDAELDHRLITQGYRIYLEPAATVDYVPRASPMATFRQYARNGYWRAETIRKHRARPQLRQTLPGLAALAQVVGLIAAMSLRRPWLMFPTALHFGACFASIVRQRPTARIRSHLDATLIAFLAHLGMGLGLLASIIDHRRSTALRRSTTPDNTAALAGA